MRKAEQMSKRRIYRKIARKYKTTVGEVKREMQNAICYAYQLKLSFQALKGFDFISQAKISSKGEIPSVEEVLQFAVTQVREKNR